MFSLMGNCISCAKKRKEPRKELTLAILGLDDVGKTTTIKGLLGEDLETAPTVGFSNEEVIFENYDIKFYDLGGGKKIRDIWKDYFCDVYGVIYVVDSSSPDRMEETKYNMKALLEHTQVTGKPILVLANKQDLSTAMDEVDICEQLDLENTVNSTKCPCRIEKCSAVKGTGKKIDAGIKDGLRWICGVISHNWDQIQVRVDRDMEESKQKQKLEAEARRERVMKIREERERKEKEEEEAKRRMGIEVDHEDSEEEEIVGDPFKRLDVNDFKKREMKLKAEKQKRKDFEMIRQKKNNLDYNGDIDNLGGLRAPRANRALDRYDLFNGHVRSNRRDEDSQNSDDDGEEDNVLTTSPFRKLTPRLPPLQRPIGTKFSANEEVNSSKYMKKKKKKEPLRTLNESEDENLDYNDPLSQTLRSVSKIDVDTRNSPLSHNGYQYTRNNKNSFDKNVHLDIYKDFENERVSPRNSRKLNNLNGYDEDESQDEKLSYRKKMNNLNRYDNDGFKNDVLSTRKKFNNLNGYDDDLQNARLSIRNPRKLNNLDGPSDEEVQQNGVSPRPGKKKGKKKKPKNKCIDERYSFDAKNLTSPRTLNRDLDEDSEDNDSYTQKSNDIYSISSNRLRTQLPTLDGGEESDHTLMKKNKKKKAYMKKNKTAPSDDELERNYNYRDVETKRDYSWTQSPHKENFSKGGNTIHDKWNLVDELPEVDSDDNFTRRRMRPNLDSDDSIVM